MNVAVIGAGTMGPGIAQVCATAGYEVVLSDVDPVKIRAGLAAIRVSLDRFVAKDKIDADEAEAAVDRISTSLRIAETVKDAEVVIEAVIEKLDVKHQVLSDVARAAPDDALIGTNTSQFSISQLGAPLGDAAERLIGTHFFNPPVLMRLVELVRGSRTTDETLVRAQQFARSLGKETVVCRKDSPGFFTTRISAIVRLECLRMLEEGVGTAADIDKALRLGLNYPMGPLELGDFNGLDTYLDVLESLAATYGERFEPTANLRKLVAEGRLGQKVGWGIYRYSEDGAKLDNGAQE